jgi:hypothetical protein
MKFNDDPEAANSFWKKERMHWGRGSNEVKYIAQTRQSNK